MTDNQPIDHTHKNVGGALQKVGNLTILSNIFRAPAVGMTQVQQRYNVIFPFFVLTILSGMVTYSYFNIVDYAWYVDYMVDLAAGELSKAEQDTARAPYLLLSQSAMAFIAGLSVVLVVSILYIIQSIYFVVVSNVNNDGYQFKQWFSFIAWTSMPGLIAVVATFASLLTSSSIQIPLDSINPLSLNELIFTLDPSKGLGSLLSSIHIAQIWSFVVMVIGYKIWTKKSTGKSAAIVLAPFVIFYVGWFAII